MPCTQQAGGGHSAPGWQGHSTMARHCVLHSHGSPRSPRSTGWQGDDEVAGKVRLHKQSSNSGTSEGDATSWGGLLTLILNVQKLLAPNLQGPTTSSRGRSARSDQEGYRSTTHQLCESPSTVRIPYQLSTYFRQNDVYSLYALADA